MKSNLIMSVKRIRTITFKNHPVLGSLSLDFCDRAGTAVDTIIIAGENGTGKSKLIEALYTITSGQSHQFGFEAEVEFELEGTRIVVVYSKSLREGDNNTYVSIDGGNSTLLAFSQYADRVKTNAVYSDVDINFHGRLIDSTTSMELDDEQGSRRSSSNLSTQINQLIVDVQALDADAFLAAGEAHPEMPAGELPVERRMSRFTSAFDLMFDDLKYSRVANSGGHKVILFNKSGVEVPIEALSSGEKQVVYRGCFLLKDANSTSGAFVFIDEPEISLHPSWQTKIMDYYKAIFTNSDGIQASQLFVVTHSPFILHGDNRRNDKVIVLQRDNNGAVVASDKPSYYRCGSVEAIEDAFSVCDFVDGERLVYVEGRTDEIYLNSALSVFDISAGYRFRWVGYVDENGQERNTGNTALKNMVQVLLARQPEWKNVCLFDSDTGHVESRHGNVLELAMPRFESSMGMNKGVENALVLDGIDIDPFYSEKRTPGDYGREKVIPELDKMALCRFVCSLDVGDQRRVLANLETVLEKLNAFFNEA